MLFWFQNLNLNLKFVPKFKKLNFYTKMEVWNNVEFIFFTIQDNEHLFDDFFV